MKAVKVTDRVWWVGAIDWSLRDFHGYATGRGSSYNAYLVLGDKVTLVDTVKAQFKDEMMARIASIIDPTKIAYIISNHSEMDHSGCLPDIIKEVKPKKVYASLNGVKTLRDQFEFKDEIAAVKDGEVLNLGGLDFRFYETKMLHWPDSMISYIEQEKILFSQDGFGMHMASSQRFDDELSWNVMEYELKKYYANILTPYSSFVEKLLARLGKLNLDIKYVAPDHGPIWRKDFSKVLELYTKWSVQRPTRKAVIIYDTMWKSTEKMAQHINEGLLSTGAETRLMPLSKFHRSDVATELIDVGAFLVGSPTINNQMFPTVADVLTYVKGLRFKNIIGTSFGSYGWGGEAVKLVKSELEAMGVDIVCEPVSVRYVPKKEDIEACFGLGASVGRKLCEIA